MKGGRRGGPGRKRLPRTSPPSSPAKLSLSSESEQKPPVQGGGEAPTQDPQQISGFKVGRKGTKLRMCSMQRPYHKTVGKFGPDCETPDTRHRQWSPKPWCREELLTLLRQNYWFSLLLHGPEEVGVKPVEEQSLILPNNWKRWWHHRGRHSFGHRSFPGFSWCSGLLLWPLPGA